jgi:hypothetical protein
VVSDADAEAIRAPLQAAEAKRWMMRIATSQLIAFNSQLLNIMGKRAE